MHAPVRFLLPLLLLLTAACSPAALPRTAPTTPDDAGRVFDLLVARDLIQAEHHGAPVSDQALHDAAMRGMVTALDDPYAKYFTPDELRIQNENDVGEFAGIGATLKFTDGDAVIAGFTDRSPARDAGVRKGDVIIAIDGTAIDGASSSRILRSIRGRPGSRIRLSVRRGDESCERLDVVLVRRRVVTNPVRYELLHRKGRRIASIRVTRITEQSGKEFGAAVARAVRQRADAVILDLRDNPGGLVPVITKMACTWIGTGTVLWQHHRGRIVGTRRCDGEPAPLANVPTVLLVNDGTASASEILSGALRDHGKATIVGTVTFGKGIVQKSFPLPSGGAVRLTTSEWRTPSDHPIHGVGIVPDVLVEDDDDPAHDAQFDRATEEALLD